MIYTYTSMRPTPAGRVSSKEQNFIIKEYCLQKSINFSLPFPEYVYPNCFVQFFNIIKIMENNSTLIAYSIYQFYDYPYDINQLWVFLGEKKSIIHFANENLCFYFPDGIAQINLLFKEKKVIMNK